ncbi:putative sodium-dependent multivitamin transporter isoform X2 [Parasteatoda tepidariorum]|uniref:Sodium-coupled monocarboxylate transporter 1 n=2 Tax=Parasteatoda tepidariorum TaxID=114398 RepID=A0A2L2YJW9_PARTP|nr:putative sodium-dependent multivitamin transporter [Parasteatoda tepidariorum]
MSVLLGITDYVVIALMLAVSASVGIFFRFTGGRQKTTQEFLMAGKNMHIFPVAFSLMATYMSAISVLGVPSETYLYGTQFFIWMLGMPLGGVIACYGFLPVFFDMDVSTAYEYLEKRFGKTTRTIASLLFTIQMILYMAVVLYAPSLALNAVTGLSTWTSVISLAVVCTFYCSLGGLKAVLWTDVFQAILMYITIMAVVVSGVIAVGGISEVYNIANEGGRIIFFNTTADLTERYTFWNSILSGILFSLHTFGTNQAQIQRMLSVGDLKRAQKALFYSLPLILLFNVFTFLDGVVIYSIYHDCDPMLNENTKLESPDQLMPYAIIKMFSHIPGLSGLCIAGVFSASLSTISSAVNSLTAVTMEDFIRPYCFCKRLTESWAAFLAKVIAVGYGGLCLLLTFIVANFRGVLEASNIMFGMVGGPVLGIYMLGMFSKTANEKGTLLGMLVGFTVNAWLGFGSYANQAKVPKLVQSTEGCPYMNTTLIPNISYTQNSLLNLNISNNVEALSLLEEEERYIFPAYKMSFLWFSMIGAMAVVIVGYIASFVINLFIEPTDVSPEYFSPFVRKLYFKTMKVSPKEDNKHLEVEMKEKYSTKIHTIYNGHLQPVASLSS